MQFISKQHLQGLIIFAAQILLSLYICFFPVFSLAHGALGSSILLNHISREVNLPVVMLGKYNDYIPVNEDGFFNVYSKLAPGFDPPLLYPGVRIGFRYSKSAVIFEDSRALAEHIQNLQFEILNFRRQAAFGGPLVHGVGIDPYLNNIGLFTTYFEGETAHSAMSFGRFGVEDLEKIHATLERIVAADFIPVDATYGNFMKDGRPIDVIIKRIGEEIDPKQAHNTIDRFGWNGMREAAQHELQERPRSITSSQHNLLNEPVPAFWRRVKRLRGLP